MVYLGSTTICDFTHPLEPLDIYSTEKGYFVGGKSRFWCDSTLQSSSLKQKSMVKQYVQVTRV